MGKKKETKAKQVPRSTTRFCSLRTCFHFQLQSCSLFLHSFFLPYFGFFWKEGLTTQPKLASSSQSSFLCLSSWDCRHAPGWAADMHRMGCRHAPGWAEDMHRDVPRWPPFLGVLSVSFHLFPVVTVLEVSSPSTQTLNTRRLQRWPNLFSLSLCAAHILVPYLGLTVSKI